MKSPSIWVTSWGEGGRGEGEEEEGRKREEEEEGEGEEGRGGGGEGRRRRRREGGEEEEEEGGEGRRRRRGEEEGGGGGGGEEEGGGGGENRSNINTHTQVRYLADSINNDRQRLFEWESGHLPLKLLEVGPYGVPCAPHANLQGVMETFRYFIILTGHSSCPLFGGGVSDDLSCVLGKLAYNTVRGREGRRGRGGEGREGTERRGRGRHEKEQGM